MKNLHVRLEYNEAVFGKKDILSSEINLLELLRRLRNYKVSRKRELILKARLKRELFELKSRVHAIEGFFPSEESEEAIKSKARGLREEKRNKDIDSQLEEIREKLARLQ